MTNRGGSPFIHHSGPALQWRKKEINRPKHGDGKYAVILSMGQKGQL